MKIKILSFCFSLAIICCSMVAHTSIEAKGRPIFAYAYYTYLGSGSQSNHTNYSVSQFQPSSYPGSSTLAWFKVTDYNYDNQITSQDFDVSFNNLDDNLNGTLDDELESYGILEKKF